MVENKTDTVNQTLYSLSSKFDKAFQMLTGDKQALDNMTQMAENNTNLIKNFIAELKFKSGLDTYVNFETSRIRNLSGKRIKCIYAWRENDSLH